MASLTKIQNAAEVAHKIGSLNIKGGTSPVQRNYSLDKWESIEVTPIIGQEFPRDLQLSTLVNAPNRAELLKDLAVLVSQRGVVFFRQQDIKVEDQKILGEQLGELSGKPASSTLHIHPTTEDTSPKGDQISIIDWLARRHNVRTYPIGFVLWTNLVILQRLTTDYAILKIHTNPPTGGDTLWASAYEVYSRLSPGFAHYLEGLEAYHEASFFKAAAEAYGIDLRDGERGSPFNSGTELEAVHPVVRTNPVTGWKGVFVNKGFTRRILGVTRDESDIILNYLFTLISENHDLQVRFKWTINNPPEIGDVAIWDNRSTYHTATFDYGKELRVGDRVVSIGEKPYFDPKSRDRREALGLPSVHTQ